MDHQQTFDHKAAFLDRIARAFTDRGVAIIRDVLTPDERLQVVEAAASLRIMHSTIPLPDLRSGRFLMQELPQPVKRLAFLPTLVRIATRLLGDNVALYHARVLIKDRHFKESVQCHQDSPYSHGLYNKLHVFLPLTANKRSNGCLQFWANSHKYGLTGQGDIDPAQFAAIEIVSEEVFPGDLVLMNHATWHFSEPATTDEERFLHQVVYQPSNDGSYVSTPQLISGEWLTQLRFPVSKAPIYQRSEEYETLSQRVAELEQEVKRLQAELTSVSHGPSVGPQMNNLNQTIASG